MNKENDEFNTLVLVIREKDGIVAEYQRQLYEAALLGVSKVKYCLIPDTNSSNNYRLDDILQKCRETADLFNIKALDSVSTVFKSSYLSTSLVMVKDNILVGGSVRSFSACEYEDELKGRKRLGEVLLKKINEKKVR